MRVTVKKWGNSAAVRIPVSVLREAQLAIEDSVEVRGENGCIVIEPSVPQQHDLDRLIDAISPANTHGEADFGPAVGREAW